MKRSEPGLLRLSSYFLSSLALHAALVVLVSLKSCRSDSLSVAPTLTGQLVTVELTTLPRLRQPKTARPGGGAPARHVLHHQAETASASVPSPAEEPRGGETAGGTPVDVIAAPSPRAIASPAVEGPSGSGSGSRGGPGGPGAGGGGVPIVSEKFAFGSDTRAAFKGVVCFIQPGILRIADVHRCDPVATFYTNTFDVDERQQVAGFPGISERSSWFMIEYTGAFTVGKDGSYDFRLHSDDGSYLFVDGAMVIENDGKHKPTSRSGSIPLQSGLHQLKLLYAQTTDRMALQLFVRVPGTFFEKLFTPRI
jgi:hypothetical protein